MFNAINQLNFIFKATNKRLYISAITASLQINKLIFLVSYSTCKMITNNVMTLEFKIRIAEKPE